MDSKVKEILMRNLKEEGLDIAETALKGLTKATFKTLREVAAATKNPLDDAIVGVLGQFESQLLAFEDKLDGKEG